MNMGAAVQVKMVNDYKPELKKQKQFKTAQTEPNKMVEI
jgi:hypothetical protein